MQSSSISGSSQPIATSVTLAQLLANPVLTNVLTVNANGEAQLNGSNLHVVQGDIVAKNANSQTGMFNAANNLTLVGSTLQTAGDLQLLAQNTVIVRDSVAQSFVAQASGNLLVQGNQGIDISALNNPNSGLLSGGDMVLRSANTVGGDAHYFSGGSFQIEQLDGSPGNLYSPHDPIIRSNGDVSFDSYTGASLDIFAGGSVTIPGTITITGVDLTG
jgi:ethanolamine utilization microcompartment shell protein EutS